MWRRLQPANAVAVTRLGVARIVSPDVRYGHPALRSLPAGCALGILPPLAIKAGSHDTGNPSLDSRQASACGCGRSRWSRPGRNLSPRYTVYMDPASSVHASVLPAEVMSFLAVGPGMRVVDGTLGGGGHTRLLAEAVGPEGLVVAIDRDPEAIERGARELAGLPVRFAQANYCDLPEVLDALAIDAVDAVLLDVGLSSDQLADDSRGFSFNSDGPLDLRFDPTEGEPAWRLVNRMKPDSLADIIYEFGEERYSRRIARKIAAVREKDPIRSARDFARLVASAIPRQSPPPRIHPATRTFQALRIAVNQELKSLRIALERIPARLVPGGRCAVISFHSLEDRLAKEAFRNRQIWECLTRSPVEASPEELVRNSRSRSAKLRAARRLGEAPVSGT